MQPVTALEDERLLDQVCSAKNTDVEFKHSFIGRAMRVHRMWQRTFGVTEAMTSVDHTLVYHIGGGTARRVQGGKVTGIAEDPRRSTLIPAYEATAWELPEGVDVLHINIDDRDLRRFAEQEFDLDPDQIEMRDLIAVRDRFMNSLAPLILAELRSGLPQSRLMLDEFDSVVAGHLLRAYSNMGDAVLSQEDGQDGQSEKKAVYCARDYLIDNLSTNVGLENLSQHVGLTPMRLMRSFKGEFGMPIRQFVIQQRVAQVRRQLAETKAPLCEIAENAGFANQPHMTRAFKVIVGVSPARYRRELAS
ncbi:MAG: AraC family transcriptional regulator [Pseudomonadota bacterium]